MSQGAVVERIVRWAGFDSGSGQTVGAVPGPSGRSGGPALRPTGVVVFATLEVPAPYSRYHAGIDSGGGGALRSTPGHDSLGRVADGPAAPIDALRRGVCHTIAWLLGR
jgi:hypothetical protein